MQIKIKKLKVITAILMQVLLILFMYLKGLESLKPSDSGFVDPKILKKFLPPPLKSFYDQV